MSPSQEFIQGCHVRENRNRLHITTPAKDWELGCTARNTFRRKTYPGQIPDQFHATGRWVIRPNIPQPDPVAIVQLVLSILQLPRSTSLVSEPPDIVTALGAALDKIPNIGAAYPLLKEVLEYQEKNPTGIQGLMRMYIRNGKPDAGLPMTRAAQEFIQYRARNYERTPQNG